jgi:prepilin-type N-terminal cleavage/methylation domain-containing protein
MLRSKRTLSQAAFSLVEMLIVIAVLGILAGIAIIGMNNQIKHSREAIARNNAIQFVSIATSARVAGADPLGADVPTTLEKIRNGITITGGSFANQTFRCQAIDDRGVDRAAYYLAIQNGELIYLADKETNLAD